MIDNDVTCLACGLWSDDALVRNNLASEGSLVLVGVNLDTGVLMVGGVLKESLL